MFGYAVAFGYIQPKTINQGNGIVNFKIAIDSKNKKLIECRVTDKLTIEWILKHIETELFQGRLVALQGFLDSYIYESKDLTIRKTIIEVKCIEFLDFKPHGFNAIDGGKFYARNMLDWETYFDSREEKNRL